MKGLTHRECENAKPREKSWKLSDRNSLYLEVMPNGSKMWRMKFTFRGKERRASFGRFPAVSLGEAREQAAVAKKKLLDGIDPVAERKNTARALAREASKTFLAVATEWAELQRWTPKYRNKVMAGLRNDVYPFLGHRSLAEIEPQDVLECLRRIQDRGANETGHRMKSTCDRIFRYGVATGRIKFNPSADLKGALKSHKKNHYAALSEKELPEFMRVFNDNDACLFPRTRRALRLSLLTFLRPGEIRQARWADIDFHKKVWIIPAAAMKMRRDHFIPLSRQVIQVLRDQQKETGHLPTDYVFPSQISAHKPMSDGTVNMAIKRLGYHGRMTAHGFRALARTIIRETLKFDSEIIEKQLAHRTRDPLGEAYDRTQFLSDRTKMMQAWADYLDRVSGRVEHKDFVPMIAYTIEDGKLSSFRPDQI